MTPKTTTPIPPTNNCGPRWGLIPTEDIPLRDEPFKWPKDRAEALRLYVMRQSGGAKPTPEAWVSDRALCYIERWGTGQTPVRCWHEAALDLAVWQLAEREGRSDRIPAEILTLLAFIDDLHRRAFGT